MKAQYKDLKFKTATEYEKWLKDKTKYIVHFADKGQDFLRWYLDENGEVLDSKPFESSIWNGCIVALSTMKVSRCLSITTLEGEYRKVNYRTIKIERK